MRSGLLFRAADQISNRYLLCRMISTSARKMNRDGISTSQCINRSLMALNGTHPNLPAEEKPPVAEPSDAGVLETQDTQAVTSEKE
jgi:hypothetical protein